jgi:hypothetical protein
LHREISPTDFYRQPIADILDNFYLETLKPRRRPPGKRARLADEFHPKKQFSSFDPNETCSLTNFDNCDYSWVWAGCKRDKTPFPNEEFITMSNRWLDGTMEHQDLFKFSDLPEFEPGTANDNSPGKDSKWRQVLPKHKWHLQTHTKLIGTTEDSLPPKAEWDGR